MSGVQFVSTREVQWKPVIEGAEFAVLSGHPEEPGEPYVIRFRTFKPLQVPPHWHPEDEHVTVLEGTLQVGLGEDYASTGLRRLEAGAYIRMPKHFRHFALYQQGTVVQVTGIGPVQSCYVRPEDDLGDRVTED